MFTPDLWDIWGELYSPGSMLTWRNQASSLKGRK